MAGQVDVFDSRELQATLVALKILPSEITKQSRKHTKQLVDAEWRKGLATRAATRLQKRVLVDTAVSSVTNTNVSLKSATKGRLSGRGGISSGNIAKGAEFGADTEAYSRYQRKNRRAGGRHEVVRRTTRQFGRFRPKGRVVYPTADDLIPRVSAMYVQTLLRTAAEAFDN